jgi:PAS domain S-box-containing protein
MKIDKKINAFFTGIIIMLSMLLAVGFITFESRQLDDSMNRSAAIIINELVSNMEFPLYIHNFEGVKKIITDTLKREDVAMCILKDKTGKVIFKLGDDAGKNVKEYSKNIVKHTAMGPGEEVMLGIQEDKKVQLGTVLLYFSTIETKKAVIMTVIFTSLLTLLVISLASLISSYLIKRILGAPINLLVENSQKIANGDFSRTMSISSKDEIGMLAEAFNNMTLKLSISLVSKDYMESIFASITESLLVTNNDGVIEMANDAAAKLIGLKKEELCGRPIVSFFENTRLDDLKGGIINSEKTAKSKNGGISVLFGASMLRDKEMEPIGFACVAVNITKIKETESKLLNVMLKLEKYNQELKDTSEKLKELDKMKSNFLSMVSHELRTPITSIKGFLTFLSRGVGGPVTAEQMDFISSISRNTERLLRLINDLLDLTKIEAGTFAVNRVDGDIIAVMNNCIMEMAPLFDSLQITVVRDFAINYLPLPIDEYRMSQAFINILNNSIKFINQESRIMVKIQTIKADAAQKPVYIGLKPPVSEFYCLISIKDEGVGIEKSKLEMIFDRFYQVEDTNTRKYQGLGLGLTITKNIIIAHDGVIWADSEGKNTGCTFNILLPVSRPTI